MHKSMEFGTRRFGRFNLRGLWTLIQRENLRFLNIWQQTVLAPLVTAGLFLFVFSIAVGNDRGPVMGLPFLTFLAPGLVMMTVIQNAFTNTSSSILSSKMTGSIVDTLMPPLSAAELTIGFLAGGVGRAVCIGVVLIIALGLGLGIWVAHPVWALLFIIGGGTFMGAIGLLGGIYAQRFDQMSALTNFVVTPLAFLSGTFYSVSAMPSVLQPVVWLNPMFYIIDGGRYGIVGVSDTSPWVSMLVVWLAAGLASFAVWRWFRIGYRLRP